ncbi:2'-5'-oligoadenylate synthetase [Branchiostoma belcheri]|nr:2'-5'-oligoadenylate synthetase [Branchiostoma belcheri]
MATGQGLEAEMEDFIVDNYVNLTARLDVKSVLPYLIQDRVLTFADKQRILHKDTGQDQAEELLDTISHTGKCTPKLFMKILEETHQTALIDSLKPVTTEKWALLDVERLTDLNILPAKLQLEFVQEAKHRLLRKADKLFDHRTLKDKKRLKQATRQFKRYKAIIESIIPEGCFVLNLRFLQPCDVDDFYHDHFRVGPGSLSAALSDILITDEMRAVVGGEELMVRLEVRYDDYIRVRKRLCTTGLKRSTSVDNLSSTLLQSKKTAGHRLLNSLDMVTTRPQDSSFTHWVTGTCTKQLVLKMRKTSQALIGERAKHEITKHQMELYRHELQHLQREGTVLAQEKEAAVKVLLEHKKEIVDLRDANKGMTESIKELTAEKTKLTDRLVGLEAEHDKAVHKIGLQEDIVRSLQREVTRLTQEQETAEKLLLDNKKEIQDLTGANKGMGDTIDELLAEKTKLTNKLALKEHEEKVTGNKVERLQGDVDRLIREKEEDNSMAQAEDKRQRKGAWGEDTETYTSITVPKDIPSTKSSSKAKAGRFWEPRKEAESPELTPRHRVVSAAKTRKTLEALFQDDSMTTSEILERMEEHKRQRKGAWGEDTEIDLTMDKPKVQQAGLQKSTRRAVPNYTATAADYATKLARCKERASTILLNDDWFNNDIQQKLAVYLDRIQPFSPMLTWKDFFEQFGLTRHELDAASSPSVASPTLALFSVLQTRNRHTVKDLLENLHNLKFYDASFSIVGRVSNSRPGRTIRHRRLFEFGLMAAQPALVMTSMARDGPLFGSLSVHGCVKLEH